jgi:hypothetical protein
VPDSTRISQGTPKQSVQLTFKTIGYVLASLAALFATNPDGGLWALAWMFPLGLAAFIKSAMGQQRGLGNFCGLHRRLPHPRLVLFPLANFAHHTFSVWRPCNSAHLQRFGMPRHV